MIFNIPGLYVGFFTLNLYEVYFKFNCILVCVYCIIWIFWFKKNNLFFIGRGIDYTISLEGSLKLKEVSYIHSEAYQAGELKHGTISLMDTNTLVISVVINDNIKEKTIAALIPGAVISNIPINRPPNPAT